MLAWRYSYNGTSWDATTNPSYARTLVDEGYTVTPLVAAPPEDGRPSYADLVEALRDFLGSDEMGMITRSHVRQHARALLSRIPREEP